jgi:APA family basic amino acid/polyamine antiporter
MPPLMPGIDKAHGPALVRGLGTFDGALITIGSILGTGIFITTADIARVLPHAGLILAVWVVGGLLTLAGALSYGELGAMFPRAGGQYHFLKEAYGPLWGFLFGWAAFLVINTGGIAALAVGFGEYLGSFVPFFSTSHALLRVPVGPWVWQVSGGQLAGAAAIIFLSCVNYIGLKEGAGVQNAVTIVKVASIIGLAGVGLVVAAPVQPNLGAPLPAGNVLSAFGVGMIAVLWSFDGWYGLTASAGEMRNPGRSLPLGLILGTLVVTILYVVMNVVYLRAMPVSAMGQTSRIGETAAAILFGSVGARLVSLAVLISTFGCISSTILWASRIYLPMAQDGLFFRSLAVIHPRHLTPGACVLAQGAWATALTLSGTYEQLYTYVVFAATAFHVATGSAVFVLRRTRPDAPRPYRTWGYPWVPALFVISSLVLVANTLTEKPAESLIGLGLVALGLPAFAWWRWKNAP